MVLKIAKNKTIKKEVCGYCLMFRLKNNLIKCFCCGKNYCYKCMVDIPKDTKKKEKDERKACIGCLINNTKLVKDKSILIITKGD